MLKRNNIYILGRGGFAKEVAWILNRTRTYRLLGYIEQEDEEFLLNKQEPTLVVLGTGNPKTNKKIIKNLRTNPNILFPNIIDPSVLYNHATVAFGEGNVICANNIITTNVQIGSFNIINLACTIGHDSEIEDFCVFSPSCNISGHVHIETGCYIGTNTGIIEKLSVGKNAIIGAGSVVTKDIQQSTINYGVPSKEIRNI